MLRFIPAIVLVQLFSITLYGVLTETAPGWHPAMLLKLGLPLLMVSVIAALWFDSIGRHRASHTIAKLKETHARDREKLQVKTEQEKHRIIKESHKEISRQSRRVSNRANLKVGLAFLGTALAGLVMIVTELVTFGMMTIVTAGGALGGYLTRVKQEYSGSGERPADHSGDRRSLPGEPPRIVNQQTGVVVDDGLKPATHKSDGQAPS